MARVLQIMAGGHHGGAETYFTRLVIALHQAGVEQRAIIRTHPERARALRDAGISTLELPFEGLFDKRTRTGIAAEIAAFQPDILQTWMYEATRAVPSGPYVHVGWLRGYQHLRDYRRCDQLIGMTQGIVSSIIEQGWPRERIHHLRPFAEIQPQPAVSRAKYDTPDRVPLLLCLGRFHWHKAFDAVIMALPQIPEAYLWIAGDGELREQLEEFARDVGVAHRVRFIDWQDNQAPLYAAADMVVVPSRYEPFGLVMIEAWAHKRPLVATKAAGPRATVQNEVDGLLVPIDDVDALAQAVRRVLTDTELRQYLVSHGYAHYKRDYTVEAVVAQYQQFYREKLAIGVVADRRISRMNEMWDKLFYAVKGQTDAR
jgi:glycosyltransferase involved in cell wall biosynthesis